MTGPSGNESVPAAVPPQLHPSSKAIARTASCASFPPTAAIEIHTSRGFGQHAPMLSVGTLPEHIHFSKTTVHIASPDAEISRAHTAGIVSPRTASRTALPSKTIELRPPSQPLRLLPDPHRDPRSRVSAAT